MFLMSRFSSKCKQWQQTFLIDLDGGVFSFLPVCKAQTGNAEREGVLGAQHSALRIAAFENT